MKFNRILFLVIVTLFIFVYSEIINLNYVTNFFPKVDGIKSLKSIRKFLMNNSSLNETSINQSLTTQRFIDTTMISSLDFKRQFNNYCNRTYIPYDNKIAFKFMNENIRLLRNVNDKCDNSTEIPEIADEKIFSKSSNKIIFKICLKNIFLGNNIRKKFSRCSANYFDKKLNLKEGLKNLNYSKETEYFSIMDNNPCIHLNKSNSCKP